jgi:protein arginine N-methyltransferase 1
VAREIARDNGVGEDRIEFIQAYSTDIELPERADVVLSDMRGMLPFLTGHFAAVADARARLLKPGGALIAQRDTLHCALATAEEPWSASVGLWDDNPAGVDMSAARRITANQPLRHHARPDSLLTEETLLGELDYTTIDSPHFDGTAELTVTRAGTAHVVPLWFDTHLWGDIKLSNAPGEPVLAYGRTVFPLEAPVDVEPGDRVRFRFRARLVRGHYTWSWDTTVTADDDTPKASFKQSTFYGEAVTAQSLRRQAATSRPALNDDGQLWAFVVQRTDGEHTLEQIAAAVHAAFPGRFDEEADALTWLARNLDGYVK